MSRGRPSTPTFEYSKSGLTEWCKDSSIARSNFEVIDKTRFKCSVTFESSPDGGHESLLSTLQAEGVLPYCSTKSAGRGLGPPNQRINNIFMDGSTGEKDFRTWLERIFSTVKLTISSDKCMLTLAEEGTTEDDAAKQLMVKCWAPHTYQRVLDSGSQWLSERSGSPLDVKASPDSVSFELQAKGRSNDEGELATLFFHFYWKMGSVYGPKLVPESFTKDGIEQWLKEVSGAVNDHYSRDFYKKIEGDEEKEEKKKGRKKANMWMADEPATVSFDDFKLERNTLSVKFNMKKTTAHRINTVEFLAAFFGFKFVPRIPKRSREAPEDDEGKRRVETKENTGTGTESIAGAVASTSATAASDAPLGTGKISKTTDSGWKAVNN